MALPSCLGREEFIGEFGNLSTPTQIFFIINDKSATIETQGGVSIHIPAEILVFDDGESPKTQIQVELTEVFDKSAMILNRLGTVSDGRLLESFGMVHLKASSEGKELRITDGGTINISFPNNLDKSDGELFYGHRSEGLFNWEYAGTRQSRTVTEGTIDYLSNGLASVTRKIYKNADGEFILTSDTTFTTDSVCCSDSALDPASNVPRTYEFKIQKLGWINCDRFVGLNDKTTLDIQLEDYSQPTGYLIFSDINSVIELIFDSRGRTVLTELPDKYTVDLIIIDNIKNRYRWAKESITLGSKKSIALKTKKTDLASIKRELRKLDK
jgi:hypothetical protein